MKTIVYRGVTMLAAYTVDVILYRDLTRIRVHRGVTVLKAYRISFGTEIFKKTMVYRHVKVLAIYRCHSLQRPNEDHGL